MRVTQTKIARAIDTSQGHVSDIINGRRPVGKATAKKIGRLTGRPWHFYLAMSPDQIREDLEAACNGGSRAA